MAKASKYVSKVADEHGHIAWSAAENKIWQALITRQLSTVQNTACDEFIAGLSKLNLPLDRIPQLEEVSQVLRAETGWSCEPVPALIGFGEFFRLLSEKKFPVATFIRSEEEFDYLEEPDIFHEIYGHCALLTNPSFANYTQAYGMMGLNASKEDRVFLARLYWFTVEFGLLDTPKGLRVYGGGILSSPTETEYALHDKNVERKPLDVLDVLRTQYRIDILQPVYFMLTKVSDLDEVRKLSVEDIMVLVEQAKKIGLHPAKFELKTTSKVS
ncbi:phenylalanine 4-monooxygenase [Colwellia sp. MB02u-10]|jgi:phenylalanine-4-hydroxylase|uniref:phenylalanine 4-monooxygenase n=1 Tax=Colwellia sp. MB02u-10 TaxID=2759828 RepID=UPI0015F5637D|nr:phenylalanine 4-monooxygenase [Colwellia sp. MB02u-10]MBA6341712.1 phenylalanine 4-monooxygenase [Colwellia sp. MB02u-10]